MKNRELFEMKASSNALFIIGLVALCIFYLISQQGISSTNFNRKVLLHNSHNNGTKTEWELEKPGEGIVSTVRTMRGFGTAAFSFVLGSAYRTGDSTFAVVGLASKPLHVFGKPQYSCEWRPNGGGQVIHVANATHLLPDWGYGRVYTVVVVHCNFGKVEVGTDGAGGELVLRAQGGGGSTRGDENVEVPVLRESQGEFKRLSWQSYKYDYLYCGSSLYGGVDPRRMREWLAYHNWFLGPNSHFVLYDADGSLTSSRALRDVLEPWVALGKVTIHDYRIQQLYDGYYYNQFMVVNDCLFRHKYDAQWTFFFDVDEYVNVPGEETLAEVLHDLGKKYTQIMFEQNLMAHNVCINTNNLDSQWGFEKLVFKNVEKRYRQDRKYVIKARLADSAGVHLSEHIRGQALYSGRLNYYHYHNTINEHGNLCTQLQNRPRRPRRDKIMVGIVPYVLDEGISSKADLVKKFERQQLETFKRRPQQQY